MISLTYEQVMQLIGAKELDIAALKLRIAELEAALKEATGAV